jgi:PBP1b-binding outer membrane lipoprotein LpoB
MKKTMTFLVLAVFASAILVGCGQTEGDPNASVSTSTDSKEGTMQSTPTDSGVATDSAATPTDK